jgi:hypothetical protein
MTAIFMLIDVEETTLKILRKLGIIHKSHKGQRVD